MFLLQLLLMMWAFYSSEYVLGWMLFALLAFGNGSHYEKTF